VQSAVYICPRQSLPEICERPSNFFCKRLQLKRDKKKSIGEELITNTDEPRFQLAMMLIWEVHTKV
jgi:hypothetical protein